MLLCIFSCSIKVRTYKSATQAVLHSCTNAWSIIVRVITHAGFMPYKRATPKLLNNFIIEKNKSPFAFCFEWIESILV